MQFKWYYTQIKAKGESSACLTATEASYNNSTDNSCLHNPVAFYIYWGRPKLNFEEKAY